MSALAWWRNWSAPPAPAAWVAPVFDLEELERRIRDLRAVHFWLEQNAHAVQATIQALEVQRMTLATLKDLNINAQEVAERMAASLSATPTSGTAPAPAAPAPNMPPDPPPAGFDPMRWWQGLAEQFQGLAAQALAPASAQAPAPEPTPAPAAAKVRAPKRPRTRP
jgi:hypothetical protein